MGSRELGCLVRADPQVKSGITEGRGRGNMATWAALPGKGEAAWARA